jgi:hypothetical protein
MTHQWPVIAQSRRLGDGVEHAHGREKRDKPRAVAIKSAQDQHRASGDILDRPVGVGIPAFFASVKATPRRLAALADALRQTLLSSRATALA